MRDKMGIHGKRSVPNFYLVPVEQESTERSRLLGGMGF